MEFHLFPDAIGILAGTLTTIAFFPQAWKVYKTRHTKDLSLGMLIILAVGTTSWFTYGLLIHNLPTTLANVVTPPLVVYILVMKLRHG